MPIVDVELDGEAVVTGAPTPRLADALGDALESQGRQLDRRHYTENGGLDDEAHPVIVTPTGPTLFEDIAAGAYALS